MAFMRGLGGLIGGLVVMIIGALLFSQAQYVYPTVAKLWMGLTILGFLIFIGAPVYYWLVAPVRRRTQKEPEVEAEPDAEKA